MFDYNKGSENSKFILHQAHNSEAKSVLLKLPVSEFYMCMAFWHMPNPLIYSHVQVPVPILEKENNKKQKPKKLKTEKKRKIMKTKADLKKKINKLINL